MLGSANLGENLVFEFAIFAYFLELLALLLFSAESRGSGYAMLTETPVLAIVDHGKTHGRVLTLDMLGSQRSSTSAVAACRYHHFVVLPGRVAC